VTERFDDMGVMAEAEMVIEFGALVALRTAADELEQAMAHTAPGAGIAMEVSMLLAVIDTIC